MKRLQRTDLLTFISSELKVRERDPTTLDAALHIALILEAIQQAAATRGVNDDNGSSTCHDLRL